MTEEPAPPPAAPVRAPEAPGSSISKSNDQRPVTNANSSARKT